MPSLATILGANDGRLASKISRTRHFIRKTSDPIRNIFPESTEDQNARLGTLIRFSEKDGTISKLTKYLSDNTPDINASLKRLEEALIAAGVPNDAAATAAADTVKQIKDKSSSDVTADKAVNKVIKDIEYKSVGEASPSHVAVSSARAGMPIIPEMTYSPQLKPSKTNALPIPTRNPDYSQPKKKRTSDSPASAALNMYKTPKKDIGPYAASNDYITEDMLPSYEVLTDALRNFPTDQEKRNQAEEIRKLKNPAIPAPIVDEWTTVSRTPKSDKKASPMPELTGTKWQSISGNLDRAEYSAFESYNIEYPGILKFDTKNKSITIPDPPGNRKKIAPIERSKMAREITADVERRLGRSLNNRKR